jgi:putative restriction endonuclease
MPLLGTTSIVLGDDGQPSMTPNELDPLMRLAAFEQVRRLGEVHDHLTVNELKPGFMLKGDRIPLINPQRGIFKPQQMRFLLSN